MKAILVNGSPRKKWNTAQMLAAAEEGAKAAGAETEWIHLFDYEFTGCKSCFACKLKNSTTEGICAPRDAARPLLEKAVDADVLIFGSPGYSGYPTGQLRSFLERLLFPNMTYLAGPDGKYLPGARRQIMTGLIYTMNCPEGMMKQLNYPTLLETTAESIDSIFGHSEVLYAYDTYQFGDYARYDITAFSEEHKREWREQQFPRDLEAARQLGMRLVELAREA